MNIPFIPNKSILFKFLDAVYQRKIYNENYCYCSVAIDFWQRGLMSAILFMEFGKGN